MLHAGTRSPPGPGAIYAYCLVDVYCSWVTRAKLTCSSHSRMWIRSEHPTPYCVGWLPERETVRSTADDASATLQQRPPGCPHGSRPIILQEQPPTTVALAPGPGATPDVAGLVSRAPVHRAFDRARKCVPRKEHSRTRGPGQGPTGGRARSRSRRPAHPGAGVRSSSPAAGGRAVQSGAPDAWLSYDYGCETQSCCTGRFRSLCLRSPGPGAPAAHALWLAGLHAVIGLRRVASHRIALQPMTKVTMHSGFVHSIQWMHDGF